MEGQKEDENMKEKKYSDSRRAIPQWQVLLDLQDNHAARLTVS